MLIKCPGCHAQFNAPERLYGKSAKCANCGTSINIPAPVMNASAPAYRPVYSGAGRPIQTVPDYMAHNIIMTIVSVLVCNCVGLALGIIGIVFSSTARNAIARGDTVTAMSSSNTAKIMFIIALVLAILSLIVIILYVFIFGVAMLSGM